ncbi:MAG TPA: DUF3304 domain-containing protein [Dyella sp.]|uniref:DUF3304 domain-containing protein n=1 Tax=Dyella sp. TaxID=1869338 RepID=UPI002BDCD4CF|nr:DUF3304 domain-containing protein [Dyella sp.]HTV87153.1 DUF3304 domain-containing protein [Dyella sp.]
MNVNYRNGRCMLWLLVLCLGLAACNGKPAKEPMTGVMLTGLDHLPDHLSVQHFTIDGTDGFQAGDGARVICCARIPIDWHEGLTAKVTWSVNNWRDCKGEHHEAIVLVTRYDHNPGHVYVHFLADGSVRVVPTSKTYLEPDYPGPHDAIPEKYPWEVWPPMQHCPQDFSDPNKIYM